MRRITILAVSLVIAVAGLFVATEVSPSAQASPSAYTYVQRVPGAAGQIQIKCHNAAGWTTLGVGQHSRMFCGSNGWVDSIRNPTTGALYARNMNTGNVTSYGFNYQGPIGGGYYEVYLSNFCGGCGGGKIATYAVDLTKPVSTFHGGGGGGGGGGYGG